MSRKPPLPLEWHPFYRDHTWLLDWLNGDPAYPPDHILVAMPERLSATIGMIGLSAHATAVNDRHIVLTRRKAAGPAPYVGRRFRDGWWCAVDHLGRGIASDSFRIYDDGSIER
jgi:hypothetical protein